MVVVVVVVDRAGRKGGRDRGGGKKRGEKHGVSVSPLTYPSMQGSAAEHALCTEHTYAHLLLHAWHTYTIMWKI